MKKKLNFKEKSFKAILNPTHIEGQIEIEIQTEKRKSNKKTNLNISLYKRCLTRHSGEIYNELFSLPHSSTIKI